jgi:hypothetical protein
MKEKTLEELKDIAMVTTIVLLERTGSAQDALIVLNMMRDALVMSSTTKTIVDLLVASDKVEKEINKRLEKHGDKKRP